MANRPDPLSPRVAAAASSLLLLVVALAVWWLQGGDGTTTAPDDQPRAAPSSTTNLAAPSGTTDAVPEVHPESGLPYVALADLPPEAAGTVELIDAGGPFPYDEDGSTFGNYEGLLPDHEIGYYREYTVETPGSPDRGARRIVAGADGTLYWTEDHYESFEVIVR
jgi:ribonuclease T1